MSQKKEEKKPTYALHIMRRDNNHISVVESANYDETYELYEKLTVQWADCIKEQKPFSLKSPVVTTFDPGLIYEITILPVMIEQPSNRHDNPYQQKMIKEGFGNQFGQNILDGGYR